MSWYDKSGEGANVPLNKGNIFIIVHADTDQGFFDGGLFVLK